MANSRKIVKVFLASPGDLADERTAAKAVVDEWNALTADDSGYQVELVGWEDTVAVFGRPQEVINRDLEQCELFIGMMWKKWGTPPDVCGPYSSGFEEEFELSVKRRSRDGKPEISLFFKDIEPAFLVDPGEDLKKVLGFKDKLIAEKTIYFERFSDIREFERKIRRCISAYLRRLRQQELEELSVKNQAPTTGGENKQAAETAASSSESPLTAEGSKFLREFILKMEGAATAEVVSAAEVARFRLLASLIGKQGNDDRALGVHDANLLFAEKGKFVFGDRELMGLVSTGLRHLSDENIPLWHWFAAIDGFERKILPYYSLVGSESQRRVGALRAMRLLDKPLPADERDDFLTAWFSEESPSTLRVAALEYLADCGQEADLSYIRTEFNKADNQTAGAAAAAIIRINMRDGREKGIAALYDVQPTSIDRDVLDSLFGDGRGLTNETLLAGVGHKNSEVRRIVVGLLRRRSALPKEIAEELLKDNDVHVRYEALVSLFDNGRSFTEDDARQILVPRQSRGGLGGLFSLGSYDPVAERYLERFRDRLLQSLRDKELEDATKRDSIFDSAVEFALAERHFEMRGEALRAKVDDKFKRHFAEALDRMAATHGTTDLIEKSRSLEEYTRKKLTRQGLDIICRKASREDLPRVRALLQSGFLDYSDADIQYLQKFGEWQDIALIIDAAKRPEAGGLLSILDFGIGDAKYRTAARAIYKLGRNRLAEVLGMPAPSQLVARLIVEITDKAFRGLSDGAINLLLNVDSEQVRKAAALKCIRVLPRKRLANLLGAYIAGDQYRYYNVVHWLDFGVSTPKDTASAAAEKVLKEKWPG